MPPARRDLGDEVSGCLTAPQTWADGRGKLPRRLRAQRRDLMQYALHGETATVLALLGNGLDPCVRDSEGMTLLHRLSRLDHEVLLPRLLAVGLPVDARDHTGRTPLHVAVGNGGSPALVRALLDAGADPHAADRTGRSVLFNLEYNDYREDDELAFIHEYAKTAQS